MQLKPVIFLFFALMFSGIVFAQHGYWQQEANYTMNIDMNAASNQFSGTQTIEYINHSPDTIDRVFYHLYFNAFQPGSMMDVRSRTIQDPDPRVGDRIAGLSDEEIGYHRIKSLTADQEYLEFTVENTILEARLKEPLLPGDKVTLHMVFESQVPLQIRRSGRDNKEGIDFSMSQWYPKLAEYDRDGWHPNPYIGREFYGIWGDFDVTINIDQNYVIGATGLLQNPTEKAENGRKSWHFKAENVHDFVWAADPDYLHDVIPGPNNMQIHFYYQNDTTIVDNWKNMQPVIARVFEILNEKFGTYPYAKYSIIQGGDGGMEYPMATLITGNRSLRSLIGVSIHEICHSWFQMLLATDEAQYAWMDEGFTTFAASEVQNALQEQPAANPHMGSIRGYLSMAGSDKQEPLTTHADHFHSNRTYGISSYSKGATFLWQLRHVVGEDAFWKGMHRYFNTWKYKHPHALDFIRVMEKESGMVLDWYYENWIGTTNTIDYGIRYVLGNKKETEVVLERIGAMPMPIEVVVTYNDDKRDVFYIPITLMRSAKDHMFYEADRYRQLADWPWTHPYYSFTIPVKSEDILSIEIDPGVATADTDRSNNRYPQEDGIVYKK